ncbi:MAG TPA: NAD-dependent epimerase/dehydratase family protein [Chitinophaga sp.]
MKIAITGATGFLGTTLLPLLLEAGHSLRLLVRHPPPQQPANGQVEYLEGALGNTGTMQLLVQGADAVIHLAAVIALDDRPDEKMFYINTEGTRILLEAAQQAGVKRFIHLSSVTAYNQAPYDKLLNEDRPLQAATQYTYEHSKAASQAIALSYNGQGLEVIVLAPTAILGPNDQRPSLLGKAVIRIYRGSIPALFPGGVNFVDVRDVASAIVTALTGGTPGKAYLLGGEWATLVTFSRYIGIVKGKKIALPVLPLWLVFLLLPAVKWWARIRGGPPFYTKQSVYNLIYSNKKIDHSRASAELQFRPRPLTTTLTDAINWFKQTGQLP